MRPHLTQLKIGLVQLARLNGRYAISSVIYTGRLVN